MATENFQMVFYGVQQQLLIKLKAPGMKMAKAKAFGIASATHRTG
jgi:hypothetical protein